MDIGMGGVLVPSRWTIMEWESYILLKLIDNQQHTQHKLNQAKLELSAEWIPVQVFEDKTEHSNPLYIPCPCLQMYQSEFGGLQSRPIGSYFKVVCPSVHLHVVPREVWGYAPLGKLLKLILDAKRSLLINLICSAILTKWNFNSYCYTHFLWGGRLHVT